MLVSPSKLPKHKILKNRTLNFESIKKTHGNFVMIMTDNYDELTTVLKSKLFRPQQMQAVFTPRLIKPLGRKTVRLDQKSVYQRLRIETDNRIKIGRAMPDSYAGRNLCYDIIPEIGESLKLASTLKAGAVSLQRFMGDYIEDFIEEKIEDFNYEKNYIIFPMSNYIDSFRVKVNSTKVDKDDPADPIILFLKGIRQNRISFEKYKKVDAFIFFNPRANAMVVLDLKDPDFERNFNQDFIFINRLNNFNNGTDILDDEDVDSTTVPDDEEQYENNKEKIRNIILKDVAKKIKADKLDDFEPTNKEESDLILMIDRKVDSYLKKPENLNKELKDLVLEVEGDNEIKTKAITYIENRKISVQKSLKFADYIEKETEIVNKYTDLVSDDTTLEPEKFKITGIPEKAQTSRLASIDEEYNKKEAKKDMMSILSAFSMSEKIPMSLDGLEIEDTSDDFDQKETLKVRYKTEDGKTLSFFLDVPKVVDKKYLYLGGNKKAITKQLIRLPIVKTKSDRVEITTNYNKVTIERTNGKLSRQNAYFLKLLNEYKNAPNIEIKLGVNSIVNAEYSNDFEYEELADSLSSIETIEWKVYFNRQQIQEEIDLMNFSDGIVKDTMTPIAIPKRKENAFVYIENGKIYLIESNGENGNNITELRPKLFDFLVQDVLKRSLNDKLPTIGKSFIYTKMKIVGEWYPVFVVLGLVNGLDSILKRYNVNYILTENKTHKPGFVEVKFADKFLYYEDTIKNTLLLNVLYLMDTENYDYDEFNLDEPYIDYLRDKLGQPQYVKDTLRLNLNLMLDPITKSILHDMKMPENITDLLLLANTMLTHNSYRSQNDMRNFRVRGNELIYAMMYELIAKAYLNYQRGKLNGKGTDSIELGFLLNGKKISGQKALITQLLTAPNINDHSILSPVLELENASSINQKGFHGINLNSAYTLELRAYSDSMAGLLSGNATPYSGSAGITRSLSYNPKISNTRGYIEEKNLASLSGFDLLSPTELLSPYTSTSADPPRQAMQVAQTKHTMPVAEAAPQLVGTGVNKTIAFMISDDFCFKAKKPGKIKKIDQENELCLLEYVDGSQDAIDLAGHLTKNSNGGFYTESKFKIVYSENEPFEEGDVIAYNPNFFTGKGKNMDYEPGALAKVAICSGDWAFEDSTYITDKLAKKCRSKVTMLKPVALGPNTIVHNIVRKGDLIKTGDHLIDFTTSFNDPATSEFLANLANEFGEDAAEVVGNDSVKAKYSGKIVDVKMYYNIPLDELSDSLKELIKKYTASVEKRRAALGGIKTASVHIPPIQQQTREKVGTVDYSGVLIEFYIEYEDELKEGDKITFSTALKGVASKRVPNSEAPITKYRSDDIIEAILTPSGVISRMTQDIYYTLGSHKVLVELQKQVYEIMHDER